MKSLFFLFLLITLPLHLPSMNYFKHLVCFPFWLFLFLSAFSFCFDHLLLTIAFLSLFLGNTIPTHFYYFRLLVSFSCIFFFIWTSFESYICSRDYTFSLRVIDACISRLVVFNVGFKNEWCLGYSSFKIVLEYSLKLKLKKSHL